MSAVVLLTRRSDEYRVRKVDVGLLSFSFSKLLVSLLCVSRPLQQCRPERVRTRFHCLPLLCSSLTVLLSFSLDPSFPPISTKTSPLLSSTLCATCDCSNELLHSSSTLSNPSSNQQTPLSPRTSRPRWDRLPRSLAPGTKGGLEGREWDSQEGWY